MKIINILDSNGNPQTFEDIHGNSINLEYRYLEYRSSDGYVVKIYNDVPIQAAEGNNVAIADNQNFEEGYEFDNYIVVQTVDEAGNLQGSCMVKQPASVKYLRQENDQLKEKISLMQTAIDDLILRGAL